MPELPEVHTTVTGLQKVLPRLSVTDAWTDLAKKDQHISHFKKTLKDASFYAHFKKEVTGQKIVSVERRAKHILINLSSKHTIVIHMKMTGHLMVGTYTYNKKNNTWNVSDEEKNDALRDPYNRFIHVVFSLSNGTHLVFCDSRKFGTVTLVDTDKKSDTTFAHIGPEPLDDSFTEKEMIAQLMKRPRMKIKQALMDQTLISGIGNIYSDEMLWLSNINPEENVSTITQAQLKKLFHAMKEVLEKGIDFGGDSTSDYRQIDGKRGSFHHAHNAYRKTGSPCGKRGCKGVILRKVIGGRSAHYCSAHQKINHGR